MLDKSRIEAVLSCLKGAVEDWWQAGNLTIAKCKEGYCLDEFLFRRIGIPLSLDKIWEFTGVIHILRSEEMDEEKGDLYRRFKGMEAELLWKGLLRKKAVFGISSDLKFLQRYVKNIKIDESLIEDLNRNASLMDLIMKAKPMEMKIYLESFSDETLESAFQYLNESDEPREAILKAIEAYYHNPKRITWFVKVRQIMTGVMNKKKIEYLIKTIEETGSLVRRFSERFKNTS